VERETAVARKRVEDAERAIAQEQDDMRNAEKAGSTTTKPETTFQEMLNPIGDSHCHLASFDHREEGEDEDDDEDNHAGGYLSDDDEPGRVMGTFCEMVQYCVERFPQK